MKPKIIWQAIDNNNNRFGAEKPTTLTEWTTIESEVFKEIQNLNPKWLGIKFEWPDGSGCLREYKKSGDVWIRTFSGNIMPRWFPLVFLGMLALLFASLAWICIHYNLP